MIDPAIESHYGTGYERSRLFPGGSPSLEFVRSMELLERLLPPPPARILDVGGGPGAYAAPLAQRGYQVHLVDPVPLHVGQAQQAAGANPAAAFTAAGDARQLDEPGASADAVLLFGPLYHLTEAAHRQRALAEARRALVPGGRLLAMAMCRFASGCSGHARLSRAGSAGFSRTPAAALPPWRCRPAQSPPERGTVGPWGVTSGAATGKLAHVTGTRHPAELDAFLASVPLFAALDETARLQLVTQFEPVHVAAGEVIIAQGEMGNGLFLVVSGRLRVSVTARGTERVLHDLGRGSTVGEIALLSHRPRSATVRAVRDSDLLVLRAPAFRSLAERSPAVLAAMAQVLIDRLLAVDRPQEAPPARHAIAVAAAGKSTDAATMVAERLAAQLSRAGPTFYMDSGVVARHLGRGAAEREPEDPGRAELIGWLHAVERSNHYVVYQTDADDTAWTRLCLSQSDVVLLAAAASDDPSPGPVEARALAMDSLRCELVLAVPGKPSATAKWLKHRPVAAFHHICGGRPQDVARLARLVTGTGCGLVLGGGGPRGFAHLGVLRALEEAGVPIDTVGGTSVGAIMGALYALGMDHAERVERAVTAFTRSGRLVSPTLPLVALSSGRRVDRLLAAHLGSVNIEDLPLGFFCVSASLTRAEEVIHEHGPLWPAARASMSLPGIFPPVYAAGDLLVDGAALNNLPVDVMRDRLGSGCVVAVDLSPDVEPLDTVPFEHGLSGWQVLKSRLNPFGTPRPVPNVVDILSRSTGLSQIRQRRAVLAKDSIDFVLRPPVAALGALDFKDGIAQIEVGYRYAADTLADSKLADRFVI